MLYAIGFISTLLTIHNVINSLVYTGLSVLDLICQCLFSAFYVAFLYGEFLLLALALVFLYLISLGSIDNSLENSSSEGGVIVKKPLRSETSKVTECGVHSYLVNQENTKVMTTKV